MGLGHFRFQRFDLQREAFVFRQLARQKTNREAGFFSDAHGGEQVSISQLVLAFLETLHPDVTLAQQGLEAIVDFAQTHAQRIGQLALAKVRVGF